MGWYIRKSINIGPVRFNLSKSGIGTSFGVKGFRIGIRPNGSSYLHAGRYGLYYREELGGKRTHNNRQTYLQNEKLSSYDTTYYNNLGSRDIKTNYKKELVQALTQSYQKFRFDYLSIIVSITVILYFFFKKNYYIYYYDWSNALFYVLLIGLIIIGLFTTIFIANWETNRRRIDLIYHFEGDNYDYYKKIVSAFNKIASCKKIIGVLSSQYVADAYLSKINAGATYLTDTVPASAGKGKMPWVNTNIDIPSINACGRSFYFMPDGLYVYDSHGVACVNYMDIEIDSNTTRFIEDYAPSDANIIDYTWQYANKSGGPDRRFNNNRQLPICLYGILSLKVRNKELLHILTSRDEAPIDFKNSMNKFKEFVHNMKVYHS